MRRHIGVWKYYNKLAIHYRQLTEDIPAILKPSSISKEKFCPPTLRRVFYPSKHARLMRPRNETT